MNNKASLYYECHVTVEPVFDDRLEQFKALCVKHSFRAATLLMKKRATDTEERSKYDTFATSRDQDYKVIYYNMISLIHDLQINDFKVWRYKIEDTLLDSKMEDKDGLLKK